MFHITPLDGAELYFNLVNSIQREGNYNIFTQLVVNYCLNRFTGKEYQNFVVTEVAKIALNLIV